MEQTITAALEWRYATKTFTKGAQATEAELSTIVEAARMAPTAYGLQPFTLIRVTDAGLRESLKGAAFGQGQVTDAGDLFVLARHTDLGESFVDAYLARIVSTRGVTLESLAGYGTMMKGDICIRSEEAKAAWASKQAYIALGFMLESAALLGVDLCPMEGFVPAQVDEILSLGERGLTSIALIPVGKRDETDMFATFKKVRTNVGDFVIQK